MHRIEQKFYHITAVESNVSSPHGAHVDMSIRNNVSETNKKKRKNEA